MEPKFKYFEHVIIKNSPNTIKNNIQEEEGIVLGIAQDDDGKWGYGVYINKMGEVWDINENEMESTGKYSKREDFYSGDSIQVRVDPKTGEGFIVDEDE